MLDIQKTLTISTAHITPETNAKLLVEPETNELCLSVYRKEDYGYYITITDQIDYNLLPTELAKIIQFTKDVGCSILCLDCDGPIIPYLETFDW